jgi:Ca2+-transporting ATPase
MERQAATRAGQRPWHALSVKEVAQALSTSVEEGLSHEEAQSRRLLHGANVLPTAPRTTLLERIIAQFTDVTVAALLVAAAIAVVLGLGETGSFLARFGDALAIGIIATLNAVIGLVQEGKAERALRSLEDLSTPRAIVRREGLRHEVSAHELVPGDVVLIDKGERIPADLRLLHASDLTVTEAELTGESEPVEKRHDESHDPERPLAERSNMTFSGTLVARGRAEGIVVATAAHTEIGRLATLLGSVKSPVTPLQVRLQKFGLWVVAASLVSGALVFGVGLLREQASLGVLALTGISLAVAAIPEGLPAITTIVLALGVQRMAGRHAIVRKLAAVEALGSADVICTDKTGTLTENRMRVRRLRTLVGSYSLEDREGRLVLSAEAQAAEATPGVEGRDVASMARIARAARGAHYSEATRTITGDPTDRALLELAMALGAEAPQDIVAEIPFNTDRKRASVCVTEGTNVRVFSHGAPERVLEHCSRVLDPSGAERPLGERDEAWLHQTVEQWASQGLRVIALAERLLEAPLATYTADSVETELTLVGLVALSDPPRAEVPEALANASLAGLRTIMITGDHPRTAAAIAREIGLSAPEGSVTTGPELEALSDAELLERVESVRVIARATAEVKLRFVDALRARGHIVAMTGDGVNDAPALKAASIGVAMGRQGTDVARDASDLVLMDDNYATIIAAVEEGRIIFANIRRFVTFLLSINTGLVLAVFTASVLGWPPLLLPIQILWINLITNGLPALALGMEPARENPLRDGPKRESLVRREDMVLLLRSGIWMAALGLGTFWLFRAADPAYARSMTFTVLSISPLFHALSSRSQKLSLFALGVFGNYRLWGAFGAALVLQALALYVPALHEVFHTAPPSLGDLAVALGIASSSLVLGEVDKWLRSVRSA